MKEFNWTSFEHREFAVHCKTEDEANNFLMECEKEGYKWCTGGKPTKYNFFEKYQGKITYFGENKQLSYWDKADISTVEWSDYMSKELNIIEASNMMNTEFEVIYADGVKRSINVISDANNILLNAYDNSEIACYPDFINAKFIPIQKPVSFNEAVASGKNIKVVKKDLSLETGYVPFVTLLKIIASFSDFAADEIIKKGEFYIKD